MGELLSIVMIVTFFVILLLGVPIGIALGAVGLFFGYLGFGVTLFDLLPGRFFDVITNYTLMAVPLFIFMGITLEKSGLVEELIDVVGHLAGRIRGGIGIAIIGVGVIMGASTGIVGATIVTVGLLTLPALIRRGYSRSLSCGIICASGTLGQIIPPSIILILIGDILELPVGSLFAGAFVPGLVLAGVYVIYLLALGYLRPDLAPPMSEEERSALSRKDLFFKVLRVLIPPALLIVAVLGSIIGGVAAPTEAASMGALCSVLIAIVAGRFSWDVLRETMRSTLTITALVFFILLFAQIFAMSFRGLGGEGIVEGMFDLIPGGVTGQIVFMLALIFVLGFFIEWIEICYIALPLFIPVFAGTDVNMVWIAILVGLTLQTSFLTPPFGWAIFFLKGVSPPDVSISHIYVGVIPFIFLQLVGLTVAFMWPDLVLWLPRAIGW